MDPLVRSRDAGVDPAIASILDRTRPMTAGEVVALPGAHATATEASAATDGVDRRRAVDLVRAYRTRSEAVA